nr:MAG TPA: hypothetical protein [Caudoviricetes sp.]
MAQILKTLCRIGQMMHRKNFIQEIKQGRFPGVRFPGLLLPGSPGKFENMEEMKMGKINIDMWYGDKPEQVTGLDIYFNDLGGFYSGNLRIFGKIVGDYYADSVQDIEKAFPHLAKDIENCLN